MIGKVFQSRINPVSDSNFLLSPLQQNQKKCFNPVSIRSLIPMRRVFFLPARKSKMFQSRINPVSDSNEGDTITNVEGDTLFQSRINPVSDSNRWKCLGDL